MSVAVKVLPGYASIVIREKVEALVIPKDAIRKGDSVLVADGNKTVAVKITRGAEDDKWVQVTHGLNSVSQSIIIQ